MSYILDALRKSERERTLVRGVGFGNAGHRLPSNTERLFWLIGSLAMTVVAVVVTVVVLRGWIFSDTKSRGADASSDAAAAIAGTTAPVPESGTESAPTQAVGSVAPRSDAGGAAEAANPQPRLIDTTIVAPAPVARQSSSDGEVGFLSTLSSEFQQSVPTMTVNIHVYSPDELQCILYINNRQYRPGEEVSAGVVVEAIVADGAVLRYRGRRFKLPRPS